MSRYLITHEGCTCRDQARWQGALPLDAAVFLWGRDVTQHTVFDLECPYYFLRGDVYAIRATLFLYPLEVVRHVLPLDISVNTLSRRRHLGAHRYDGEALVCRIGGTRP